MWPTRAGDADKARGKRPLMMGAFGKVETAWLSTLPSHRQAPRSTLARCSPSVPTVATPSRRARDSLPVNPGILHLCVKQHLVAENSGHRGDLSWCL